MIYFPRRRDVSVGGPTGGKVKEHRIMMVYPSGDYFPRRGDAAIPDPPGEESEE